MNRKQKLRYTFAIYTIILSIAVILALIVFFYPFATTPRGQNWQAFWLNISTDFIGVVVVFFIVNVLFLLDDWDLSERVDALLKKLNQTKPSADQFFLQKRPELDDYIRQAKQIDLCGVTLTSTINKQLGNLRQCLGSGGRLRVMVIDPASAALGMAADRGEQTKSKAIQYYTKRIDATFNDLVYLHENLKLIEGNSDQIEVRLLPYPPSFGFYGFEIPPNNSCFIVEYYPHHSLGHGVTPSTTLTRENDAYWYNFYKQQYETMWERATIWEPTIAAIRGAKRQTVRISADEFFEGKLGNLSDEFAKAKEIVLYGQTLSTTLRAYTNALSTALENGGKLTAIVSTAEVINRHTEGQDTRRASALKQIAWIQDNPKNQGEVELREYNYHPRVSILAIDPNSEHGLLYVRLYAEVDAYQSRPKFALTKSHDPHWYNYFKQQLDLVIEQSKVVPIETLTISQSEIGKGT
ncbi:MAG: hypothetical protein KDE51_00505 [Anaerolineales bacterium]|nr:hypothetical protein [Anaerolineales bacterium]